MGTLATLPVLGDIGGPQFTEYGQTGFGPIGGYTTPEQMSSILYPNGAPTLPTATVAPNNGINFENPWLNKAASAINSVTGSGSSSGGLLKSILSIDLEDLIFIILGLLLLAAGIFSFRQTQTIIREGGKAAATVAAAA